METFKQAYIEHGGFMLDFHVRLAEGQLSIVKHLLHVLVAVLSGLKQ